MVVLDTTILEFSLIAEYRWYYAVGFDGAVTRVTYPISIREVGDNENNSDVSGDIACDYSDYNDVRMYR